MLTRRGFVSALVGIIAAPAIVRIDNIMPVKAVKAIDLTSIGFRPLLHEELIAVTRKAFIPRLVVQLYKATPLLAALIEKGNHDEWVQDWPKLA
jgi:hypothetical protein